jgi:hypothetical protein
MDKETKDKLKGYIYEKYILNGTSLGDILPDLFNNIKDITKIPVTLGDIVSIINSYVKKKRNHVGFVNLLNELREKKNIGISEHYTRANMGRGHYHNIISNIYYHPTKETVILLGLSLELDRSEMDALLEKAGFILTDTSVFDLVIMFCIETKMYNIYDINNILLEMGQHTLTK